MQRHQIVSVLFVLLGQHGVQAVASTQGCGDVSSAGDITITGTSIEKVRAFAPARVPA